MEKRVKRNQLLSQIKEEWITRNLLSKTKVISLKEIGAKYKIKYGTMRNRAMREGWSEELARRQLEIAKEVTAEVQKELKIDIKEMVTRQLAGAKLLYKFAAMKLNNLVQNEGWKDIPVSKIPEFMKTAAEEERRALGISDKLEVEIDEKPTTKIDCSKFSRDDFATFRKLCNKAGLDPSKLGSPDD